MPRPYDAILFDFDGVLVDSEPLHYECWCEIIAPFGFTMSWRQYETNCIGVSDKAMIRALCGIAGRDDLFDPIWQRYPDKKALFRKRMLEHVPMPEATHRLLHSLNGMRLAVVSSSGRTEIEPALEVAGVRGVFEAIISAEDVRNLKPSPEPYQTAATRLGAANPLVVEDSEAGLASGRAAGFDVLRVPHASETAGLVRGAIEQAGLKPSDPVKALENLPRCVA